VGQLAVGLDFEHFGHSGTLPEPESGSLVLRDGS